MNKLSILKQVLAIGALFFIVTACDKNELAVDASAQQLQSEIPIDIEALPFTKASYEVAKITKDGSEYLFEAIGEENEMAMVVKLNEFAEENDEVFTIAESNTPFEAFIALTDDNVKIPLRIAQTVDESVVKASNREISESSSLLEILDTNDNTEASSRGCRDLGYNGFRDKYCYGGTYRSKSLHRVCDNWLSTRSYHNSNYPNYWLKGKKVRTWTNVLCGKTRVAIFNYNGYNNHKKEYEKSFTNGVWYVNWYPNTPKYRIVARTTSNGSKFRAFTQFY